MNLWFKKKNSNGLGANFNVSHLRNICKSKLQLTLSLNKSGVTYRSMFVDLVNLDKYHGIMIDTLLPKDGDLRLKPETYVTISYVFQHMNYNFNSLVIKKVEDKFPSFLLTLPKAIHVNN